MPSIPDSHSNEPDDKTDQGIIELSLGHPAYSRQRIADQLNLKGISVCVSSVRSVQRTA